MKYWEGITRRSINYSRKRKSEYACDLWRKWINEWKHFRWQILLSLQPICLIVFLFCLHFCILSHFEIIRCIAKSLIATSTYFLLEYNWKKKTWKVFLGARVWEPKLVYRSPKRTAWIRHWKVIKFFFRQSKIGLLLYWPKLNSFNKSIILNVVFICFFIRMLLTIK